MIGWAFYKTSQRAHYFSGSRSLCGKWKCKGITLIIVPDEQMPLHCRCKECHNRKIRWGR